MGSEFKKTHKISIEIYQHLNGIKNIIYVTIAFWGNVLNL